MFNSCLNCIIKSNSTLQTCTSNLNGYQTILHQKTITTCYLLVWIVLYVNMSTYLSIVLPKTTLIQTVFAISHRNPTTDFPVEQLLAWPSGLFTLQLPNTTLLNGQDCSLRSRINKFQCKIKEPNNCLMRQTRIFF